MLRNHHQNLDNQLNPYDNLSQKNMKYLYTLVLNIELDGHPILR